MVALAPVVVIALHTRIPFKGYRAKSPHDLLGSTESKMAASDQLPCNGSDLHRRSFIVLLLKHFEMTSINTPTLLEKVAYCDRAFVIDNTIRYIDEFIAKLRNQCLYRDFINGTIGWNAGNDVAKRDHFAQFRMYTRYTVM